MAKTSNSKKSFVIMLVAIIVVAAAIAFIVFEETTSKSDLFENQDFAAAVGEALGKAPAFITKEDLEQVKYVEISANSEDEYFVALAYDDLLKVYREYLAAYNANEDTSGFNFGGLFKGADFTLDSGVKLDDVKLFTSAEVVTVSGIQFSDSSVFEGMPNLTNVDAMGAGLTEVNGLAHLDAEKVDKINLASNNVADWSVLDYIKDKVTVEYYYTIAPTEDGTIDYNNLVLVEKTLAERYEELAKAEEEKAAEEESTDENESETETADAE